MRTARLLPHRWTVSLAVRAMVTSGCINKYKREPQEVSITGGIDYASGQTSSPHRSWQRARTWRWSVGPSITLTCSICATRPSSIANLGTSVFLSDVWGSAPYDVYVIGDNGTVLHFDGSTCAAVPLRRHELDTAVEWHDDRPVRGTGHGPGGLLR